MTVESRQVNFFIKNKYRLSSWGGIANEIPDNLTLGAFRCSAVRVALAESKAAKNGNPPETASAMTTSQAMREREALYGGGLGRGHLGRDRYAYIERCFKDLTGMYPSQVNQNCSVPRC